MNGPIAGEWMCLFETATFWMTGHPRRDVVDGVQAAERMERTAVMAGRQIRAAHHRQRRGEEHVLGRRAGRELVVRGGDNAIGRRLLDELD
jgi:hypothetical protein